MNRQGELEILIRDLKRTLVAQAEKCKGKKHEAFDSYMEDMFGTVRQLEAYVNEYNKLLS